MKCHYELLEVSRDASSDDIKKSYRKLAMKWHPDKNLENTEEATEQFKLIQQAFDVLSDPHERAWYDDHREAILKGKTGSQYDDKSVDVFQYFSASCFQGFGDDEKGFYSVYREVFNKIAAEDSEYQTDGDSDFEIPNFGKSDSSFEEVNSFYNYWQSYITKKSYSWLDEYDTREAPNRRVSRLMEKENKKIRDKARKARSEEIKELVKFVRKRDKRVAAYAQYLQDLSAEKAKKSEEKRLQKIKARKSELAEQTESEWSKFSNFENELKDIEANVATEFGDSISSENSDNEEVISDNNLYCVACNKLFKNPKAFENHESSKKHKDNVEILKEQMKDSDYEFDSDEITADEGDSISSKDGEEDDGKAVSIGDNDDHTDGIENQNEDAQNKYFSDASKNDSEFISFGGVEDDNKLFCKPCGRWFKSVEALDSHKASQSHVQNSELYKEILKNLGSDTELDDDDNVNETSCSSHGSSILDELVNEESDVKKDLERLMSRFDDLETGENESLHEDVEKICAEIDDIIKKNKELEEEEAKISRNRKKKKLEDFEDSSDDMDFSLGQSKKQKRKQKNKRISAKIEEKNKKSKIKKSVSNEKTDDITSEVAPTAAKDESLQGDESNTVSSDCNTDFLVGTSKSSTESRSNLKKKQSKKIDDSDNNSSELNNTCAVCNVTFPSKNKLFQHLTKTGHSVYLPEKSNKNQEDSRCNGKKGKSKKNNKK